MAKNYNQNYNQHPNTLPRKIVIKRILAFSKFYNESQENKKNLDLLKN
tara:strand:+ start:103 stop:246 length:144 start_codon:yes stop_codon:yes gene_type:complete